MDYEYIDEPTRVSNKPFREPTRVLNKPFEITMLTADESKTLCDLYDHVDVMRVGGTRATWDARTMIEHTITDINGKGDFTNEFWILAIALTNKHLHKQTNIMDTFADWYNKHDRMILWMQANGEPF